MKKNCIWLTCALILSLSATASAWADSYTSAQTSINPAVGQGITNTPGCSFCQTTVSATSLISNSGGTGNASASAGFGALDAASSATSGVSSSSPFTSNSAFADAYFQDSFSVLSGSSGTGTFQIAFVSTGTTVSATGNGFAEIFLKMLVGNGSFLGALSSVYDVRDCEPPVPPFISCGGLTTNGLPTTVFNIDASNGDTIVLSGSVEASSYAYSDGSGASAVDPVSVFITAPAGFTYATASGATYSPTTSAVPEPGSLFLLSSGLACLGAWRRRMLNRI
jgi:hypothetical protein